MPWTCPTCGHDVPLDDQLMCPACGAAKTAWSVALDSMASVHRTFTLPKRKRLEIRRGRGVSASAGSPRHRGIAWCLTKEAPVVSSDRLVRLARSGLLPDPEERIAVWMYPGKLKSWALELAVAFEKRPVGEVVLEFEKTLDKLGDEDHFSAQLVCFKGELPADVKFPQLHLIEVGEQTELGHAPKLEISGFRTKAKPVQLVATEEPDFFVDFLDVEDVSFHFDSAVLMPDPLEVPPGEEGERGAAGLQAVEHCLRFAQRHPQKRLLVAGHTDSSGADAYNEDLSRRRSTNVLAFIQGDKATWAQSSDERHQLKDVQQILTFVARTEGVDCDPQGVDGVFGSNTRRALGNYREAWHAEQGLPAPGPGPNDFTRADWEAAYDYYERELVRLLNTTPETLPTYRDAVTCLDPPRTGCGENFPARFWQARAKGEPPPPKIDGQKNQADRRVELLFFDPGEEPDIRGRCHPDDTTCRPEQCELYRTERYKPRPIPIAVQDAFTVSLVNEVQVGIPEARFVLSLESGDEIEGILGPDGKAKIVDVPNGEHEITYQDPDDVLAKAEAAHARRAIAQGDVPALLSALRHSPLIGVQLEHAYGRYFNDLSGKGLIEDVYEGFSEPKDVEAIEVALLTSGLEARGSSFGDMEQDSLREEEADADAFDDEPDPEWFDDGVEF